MGSIWTIIIGFVAGVIAKFLHPGSNEPSGFILTAILGTVGAFVATWLGQALGWYRPGEGAGLIGAVVGAVIVLAIWSMVARRSTRSIRDPARRQSAAPDVRAYRKAKEGLCGGHFGARVSGNCRHTFWIARRDRDRGPGQAEPPALAAVTQSAV